VNIAENEVFLQIVTKETEKVAYSLEDEH
jgi:hypothetical protein